MKRRPLRRLGAVPLLTATVVALVLSGCSSASSGSSNGGGDVNQAAVDKADAALKALEGQVLSTGPNGEAASSVDEVKLSDAQLAQVQAMGAKAAIVMHYGGNDWSTAQVDGLQSEFKRLGIQVVATTDADFKPEKQVSDIETVMTQNPNVIVSIPTDPVATASAYRAAAQAGAKLVFMDNVPDGFKAGQDYVSMVSADNYGNGVVSAHLLARSLGGSGKVGVIYHNADFFVTKQRYDGFKKTVEDQYPDMQIVADQGIAGPDFAGDAQAAANAMLSQHPDLDAIWAVWDVPAEGVLAAARAAGRTDLKVATQDLGLNVAIALAKNELVVGLGAQRPFDQGVTEARLAALSLLGQPTPAYVALPALPVDHKNVLDAWKQVYHSDPPSTLADSYKD
ncbi:MAG: Monosaccharide transporter substrate-binding protein family [Modestobacter sp.]|nr:Monosaccharide transporter substrate-binding protein family [Modestobacter sp.]